MLLNHSPEKENRSPEAKRRDKQNKQIRTSHELLQTLALHNHILSQQLTSHILAFTHPHITHHDKEIKLFGKDEEMQQLRVKLADYEFELKKMGEDFAEFQLLAKMDRDRHVKRLKEELETERTKNVEDNSKWEKKFAERLSQYEKDCVSYRAKIDEESRKAIAEATTHLQAKHQQTVHRLNTDHSNVVKGLQKSIEGLRVDFDQRLKTQRQDHQRELLSQRKTHEIVLKQKEEIFETKIVAVECEKKAEMRLTEQTKKESTKIQEKYLYQIGTIEREKRKLQERLEEAEMRAKVLAKRLEDRTKEAELLKEIHTEQLERAENDRSNAIDNARAILSHEKAQFLREEYARTEQIELKLIKLNQEKEQMQGTYEGLLRTLQTRFQRRESKKQDIEAMREYEEQLISKQRENTQIYQQLRMVQLEKENNDKIYTRIFTSAKKKSLHKETAHNDIHALFKQSHTTDFRHLLKIAQK